MNIADWITAYVDANATFYTGRSSRGTNFWSGSAAMLPNRFQLFIDPADVSEFASGAQDVLQNVKRYTRNGSIITFHDSLKSIDKLREILPQAIEWLMEQGYEFKTL